MENMIVELGFIIGGLILGFFIGQYICRKSALQKSKTKADVIIKTALLKAEEIKKNKLFQAKERFLELKSKHRKEIMTREEKTKAIYNQIIGKDKQAQKSLERNKHLSEELEHKKRELDSKLEALKIREEKEEAQRKIQIQKLEKLSGLSSREAKEHLIKALEEEAKTDAMTQIRLITEEATFTAQKEAKKIVIQTIQRIGTEESIDNTISTFHLESDDLKGKIIGREGRNIRSLEDATGVEILVDDTPEAIILSCFDPVRREIARLSLHRLVTDGRIHPARIEEVVAKVKKQITQEIVEIGKRTIIDLGIHGLHSELVRIIGRMKYRSSYGQNLLQHSREVSKLCAVMAAELGLDVKAAKRAGLLHDIGKVIEEESEHPHAILGMKWAEKFGERPKILNAIGAHHDEIEMTNMISPIVQVCDSISGARPGARHQLKDSYVQRLKDLETIALGFDGVEKAYAIQAGRELRVIVSSDKVDDNIASKISYEITEKIKKEMTYPGQVKVIVIRETRIVNIAK